MPMIHYIYQTVTSTISHEKSEYVPHRVKKYSTCIMRLSKAVTTTAVIMGFVVFVIYYNMFNLMNFFSFVKLFKEMISTTIRFENDTDYILATKGCTIPNFSKTLKFIEAKYESKTCGHRAIFLEKIGHSKIRFIIQGQIMKLYSKGKHFTCCYKFAIRSTKSGNEDTALTYWPCKRFKNETIVDLKKEVIIVLCRIQPIKNRKVIYKDAYIIVKKINILKDGSTNSRMPWNVMLVGMDTMSRARAYETMPHTVQYLHKHNWLDFRGYQKVGFNTFPNLMALLTGKKISTVYNACEKGMTNCNELLMWSKYKDAGYVTAYGEDYLKLPDTFSPYKGFNTLPTNHYARPFFLTGEESSGNYICTQKKPSGVHLLDYALDFAETYENDNFFGMFWLNSFSHNAINMPALIDDDVVRFFEKLKATHILKNTFIVFLSDHGIRYGETRLSMESYYDERLPMFFMWVPYMFQEQHYEEYNNLKINQNRLSTPYDLHLTMWNILKLSNSSVEIVPSEACSQCESLFYEKMPNRTCTDAGVSEKWCSCHKMIKIKETDEQAKPAIQLAVSYIQKITKKIETIECTECEELTLKSVLRHHYYVNGEKTYYIVAVMMAPGNEVFEMNIEEINNEIKIVEPTVTITAYNTRSNCVQNPNYRSYCVCKKLEKCKKKTEQINLFFNWS